MLQRYLTGSVNYIFVIGISITLLLVASCGTHHAAQVSDRDPPPSRRIPVHYVSRGETLYSIAWRYGIDYRELAQGNRISPPYTIYPGQKLYLFAQKTQPSRTTVGYSAPKKEPAGRTPRQPQKVPPMATKTPPGQVQRPPVKITQPARLPPPRVVPRSESKTTASAKQTLPPLVAGAPQWQWPAQGKILSSFQSNSGLNKGIDIAGNLGQPVLAAAAGRVVYAGEGLRGYGKLLIIKHNESFLSAYAHNDRLLVKEGDPVKGGQKIADMGSSSTDRIKLHFEIRREGTPVDPMKYLPRR